MSELIERLRQLAKAVTEGPEGWHREFTMRVPAEPKRDADLVISTAADELERLTKQRDELRALLDGIVDQIRGDLEGRPKGASVGPSD